MLRIVAVGASLIALLASVKQEHVLERSHMVGSCDTIARRVDGSEWRACVPGRLTGRPGLELSGCTDFGRSASAEVWHCPAPVTSAALGSQRPSRIL